MDIKNKKIHIAGIGGEGWSWIAKVLLEKGNDVRGCNLDENAHIKLLKDLGLNKFDIGNSPDHITNDLDYFLYTSAILSNEENKKELDKAKEMNIKALDRNEFLPLLLNDRKVLAIAGTHGKTTTSALLAYLLDELEDECGFGVGGNLINFKTNGRNGETETFVVEADEFADAFLGLNPYASIITNIEMDHHDYFINFDRYKESFKKFINQTKNFCVVFGDDQELLSLAKSSSKEIFTYGEKEFNDFKITNINIDGLSTKWKIEGSFGFASLEIPFPGKQYAYNATAVFAMCYKLGYKAQDIISKLKDFKGTERRFQVDKINNIYIVNDYGHHPSEIKITLEGALNSNKKIVVVYEPHQYKRCVELKAMFEGVFAGADYLFQTAIFASREKPPYEITSEDFFEICSSGVENKFYIEDWNKCADKVFETLKTLNTKEEILVLVFAVGHGTKIVESLLEKLK